MQSKLDTLSAVIIVSGIIGAIIIALAGFFIYGDLIDTNPTSSISGYVLIAAIITAFSLLTASLTNAFSLQAKAEQLDTEKEILRYCHSISKNIQTLAEAQSAAQQTDDNADCEKINLFSDIYKSAVLPKAKPANPSWICKNCKEANPGENKACSKCGNPKSDE